MNTIKPIRPLRPLDSTDRKIDRIVDRIVDANDNPPKLAEAKSVANWCGRLFYSMR